MLNLSHKSFRRRHLDNKNLFINQCVMFILFLLVLFCNPFNCSFLWSWPFWYTDTTVRTIWHLYKASSSVETPLVNNVTAICLQVHRFFQMSSKRIEIYILLDDVHGSFIILCSHLSFTICKQKKKKISTRICTNTKLKYFSKLVINVSSIGNAG